MREVRHLRLFALLAALVLVFAACGGDDDDGGGGGGDGEVTIIHGTTDSVVSLDPAGAYDLGSYALIYNVYNGLLKIDPGATEPTPDLAESCDFHADRTYTCTLKEGVTFHDGSDLTSEDVKFSFDRNLKIADPNGASSLYANLDSVDTPDESTVTFNLKADDATWPFLLTVAAAFIVPSDAYSGTELHPDDQVIGTGPYRLAEYRSGEQAVLESNPDYFGDAPANDRVIVQYYDKSSALKLAIENAEVDIAYRSLLPTELADLEGAEGVQVLEGEGTEIRYMVFNMRYEPGNQLPVRQAIAQVIDRESIAQNVYNGTVDPLYSMVPVGLGGHTDAFAEEFAETPDVAAAEQALADAGIQTPVELEIWWTPTHYGDSSADEYAEIRRQLEESGLFSVTLKSTEWDQYSTAAFTNKYPIYQLGWFPDYPDADNYTTPFFSKESFLNIHYNDPQMEKLLAEQKASTDQAEREQLFQQIQDIAAEDIPTIPIWQGKQIAVVRDGVTNVEETLDAAFIFRYYVVSKSE